MVAGLGILTLYMLNQYGDRYRRKKHEVSVL